MNYYSGAFHPDGALFAAADSDSVIHIWDALKGERVQTFEGHAGSISSLSFSENGYYLATGDDSANVKIWDLRKVTTVSRYVHAVKPVRLNPKPSH